MLRILSPPLSAIMQGMKKVLSLIGCWFLICTVSWAQGEPQMNLPRIKLQAGMHLIDAQVASTPQQREIGLMFRREMPAHEGMLFVFEAKREQCFWMKNTLLPLTAAFIDDDGSIVNLVDMSPMTTQTHCSLRPVRYVLEMNKGWFAKKKMGPGDRIMGLP